MLREKLSSITKHISNTHSFTNNIFHKHCSHAPLEPDEQRRRPWLHPGELAIGKVNAAFHGHNDCRWKDLSMMTKFTHTGKCGLAII